MADTTKIRIGMSHARELEFEVVDGAAIEKAFADATAGGDALIWIDDAKGGRYGLAMANVAFLEIAASEKRSVGL